MKEASSDKSTSKIKIPIYLEIVQFVLYIFPSCFLQYYIISSEKVLKGQGTMISTNPLMASYQFIYLALAFLFCYFGWTLFKKYDETPESAKKINV